LLELTTLEFDGFRDGFGGGFDLTLKSPLHANSSQFLIIRQELAQVLIQLLLPNKAKVVVEVYCEFGLDIHSPFLVTGLFEGKMMTRTSLKWSSPTSLISFANPSHLMDKKE